MTRQHLQLLQSIQDLERLALHIAYNSEYKPGLESVTKHFVDAFLLRLEEDRKELQHIINMQMK